MYMARLRSGHRDIDRYSPVAYLPSARTPLFMIAAENDGIMPPEDVRALFAAAPEPKEFWMVPGATHAKCRQTAPADYEKRVAAFFRARLG
jgi:fermentation-respiration switch protein FrsA (DUF1100 family)